MNPKVLLKNSILYYLLKTTTIVEIKNLIKLIDLKEKDENGNTLLHLAIFKNNVVVTKVLLTENVNPNLKNNLGITPFTLAVQTNKWKIVTILLAYDVDLTINYTFTPNIFILYNLIHWKNDWWRKY